MDGPMKQVSIGIICLARANRRLDWDSLALPKCNRTFTTTLWLPRLFRSILPPWRKDYLASLRLRAWPHSGRAFQRCSEAGDSEEFTNE